MRPGEEDSAEPAGGPIGRLIRSTRNLVANLLTIVRTRLELITVELQIEAQRVAILAVLAVVALFAAGIGLIFAAVTVILIFWDTHRVLAAFMVTGAFVGVSLVSGLVLLNKIRTKPRLLAATLAELAADARRLRGAPSVGGPGIWTIARRNSCGAAPRSGMKPPRTWRCFRRALCGSTARLAGCNAGQLTRS